MQSNEFENKNPPSYNATVQSSENWPGVGIVIIESPCSSTDESEPKPVNYEVKFSYAHLEWDQDTLIEQSP